jgi:hypothetical protein
LKSARGNPDIGRKSIERREANQHDVYEAVRILTAQRLPNNSKGWTTLKGIWNHLDKKTQLENKQVEKEIQKAFEIGDKKWTPSEMQQALNEEKKKTIRIRTIQNCIKRDPKIKKDGWHFYIDDEARFEKRYLNPREFGRRMYEAFSHAALSNVNIYNRNIRLKATLTETEYAQMYFKNHIIKLGLFLVYSFFEGARPFRDQSMSLDEREDLVHYWVQNSMPLYEMFYDTTAPFDPRSTREKSRANMAPSEIDERAVIHAHGIMEKAFPELYKIIDKVFKSEVKYAPVGNVGESDHFVRGKSYHKSIPDA